MGVFRASLLASRRIRRRVFGPLRGFQIAPTKRASKRSAAYPSRGLIIASPR
jgi:hypothetical protein